MTQEASALGCGVGAGGARDDRLWGCRHRPRWSLGLRGLDNSSGDTGWGFEDMVSGPPRSLLGWGHWGRGPGGRWGRPGQGGGMSADTSERVSERAPTSVTDSKR